MRYGPKMRAAVCYVIRNGGAVPSMCEVARYVGPNGSTRYGYATVHRAIRAGLLAVDPAHHVAAPSGSGAVVLTDRGSAVMWH